MRISRIIALALLLGTAWTPLGARAADHPLKGVALVIGESDYQTIHKLDNPKRDARAMDDMLDQLGFQVDRVLDGDTRKLRAEIADFVTEAKDADVALVYYSGHGVEAGGTDFLVPIDTDLSSPQSAGASLVPVSDLLDQLSKTVPVTIMLLDACRTNSFPEGTMVQLPGSAAPVAVGDAGLEALRGPVPVAKPDVSPDNLGVVIGFAASPGEPALDGDPGGNSPYAAALLKHFSAGGYSFGDLMTMVSEEVYLKTKARQLPWTNSSLRRVLSFGQPIEPQAGDDAEIRDGRRKLLLTIAQAPDSTRKYVETVARAEGVPLDALYGMLKVLGVDTTSDQTTIEEKLEDGAKKLKDFLATQPGGAKTDAELIRLSGLADKAQQEGAIDLALKFRAAASQRADQLAANVDVAEANIKADRIQIGDTYGEHARTAVLNFDFATAALMSKKAYEQVEKWDAKSSLQFKRDEADALYHLGLYKGQNDALEEAIKVYGETLELTRTHDAQWAAIENDLGNALQTLGSRQTDRDLLTQAIDAYKASLKIRTKKLAPLDWAGTEGNLGVTLQVLGQREASPDTLQASADAFAAALEIMTRDNAPLDWARMESNYGNALQLLGDRTNDPSQYQAAAEAQRAALKVLTRDLAPLDWATMQSNLGIALARVGEGGDAGALNEAIDAFKASLEERSKDKVPLDWAATEDNMGSAYASRGAATLSSDDMNSAIEAFNQALSVRLKEVSPLDWATTIRNRGLAQKKLGEMVDNTAWYDRAIEDYQAALTGYTRDASPLDWAQTEADLGIAALARADRTGSRDDLWLARDAYAAALEVYAAVGQDYADYFQGKLDDIDKRLRG